MSPGVKVHNMSPWGPEIFGQRRIVVADEDKTMVAFIMNTLRDDGHAVFHAYDVLSAVQLAHALEPCDLVISNTRVQGTDGVDLINRLRRERPELPIIYLANLGRSTPEIERQLPPDVPILREPFTVQNLRSAVYAKLDRNGDGKRDGSRP
jgi:two-component system, OmpR family, response regulator